MVVLLAAVVYNLPRFFERRVVTTTCHGLTLPRTEKTALRKNREYFLVYKTVCYLVFRAVGPLVTLIVLNSQLVGALRAVRRRRRRLLVQKKTQACGSGGENLTLMLVTVVTVFIVCQLPDVGIRIAFTASVFAPSVAVRLDLGALRYANVASNALITLNSAINFAVYCLVGKKFRRIFVREVATCCRRGKAGCNSGSDGDSVTFRQVSQAATEPASRCPNEEDMDATQLTEIGHQQRSPRPPWRRRPPRQQQHNSANHLQVP